MGSVPALMRATYAAAAIFCLVAALDCANNLSLQGDSRWTIPQALSLIHQHNFDLDEYASRFAAEKYYFIECVTPHERTFPVRQATCPGGHFYYRYPVAVSIVAVPFVLALQGIAYVLHPIFGGFAHGTIAAFLNGDFVTASRLVEIIIASVFVGLAAMFLLLAILEILPLKEAIAVALVFAFGTSAWSIASRALFQHAPSMALNCALLYVVLRSYRNPRILWLTGPVAALAFFIRPTNVVPLCVLGAFLLWRNQRQAVQAAVAALPIVVVFIAISYGIYGAPLAPYFSVAHSNTPTFSIHRWLGPALLANWISPARGLLIFCPFLVLLALPLAWRTGMPESFRLTRPWLAAIVVIHWVLVSLYEDWIGGYSYGPRYMCDIVPYLMVLMAPVFLVAFHKRTVAVALVLLVAVSLFIHGRGAYSVAVHQWNSVPVSVNDAPWRVWDWSDPPFLRGL